VHQVKLSHLVAVACIAGVTRTPPSIRRHNLSNVRCVSFELPTCVLAVLAAGALANVDALEDATLSFHWCWELRSFSGLPKAVKAHADAARKHRKQVGRQAGMQGQLMLLLTLCCRCRSLPAVLCCMATL
jgi:hypothetical protein